MSSPRAFLNEQRASEEASQNRSLLGAARANGNALPDELPGTKGPMRLQQNLANDTRNAQQRLAQKTNQFQSSLQAQEWELRNAAAVSGGQIRNNAKMYTGAAKMGSNARSKFTANVRNLEQQATFAGEASRNGAMTQANATQQQAYAQAQQLGSNATGQARNLQENATQGAARAGNYADGQMRRLQFEASQSAENARESAVNGVNTLQGIASDNTNAARASLDFHTDALREAAATESRNASNGYQKGLANLQRAEKMYSDKINNVRHDAQNGVQNTFQQMRRISDSGVSKAGNMLQQAEGFAQNLPSNMFNIIPKGMTDNALFNGMMGAARQGKSVAVYPEWDEPNDSDEEKGHEIVEKSNKQAEHLLKNITEMRKIFMLSSQYYGKLNHHLMIPTIVITAASGFVSFLGGSTAIPAIWKQYIAMLVGLMATVATILGGLSSTFKWNSKADAFGQAAQQFSILESKLQFAILTGEDCHEKFNEIQEVMIDISKGMRFFPPEDKLREWWEAGLIDEMQKREPLPKFAKKWTKDLGELGINEQSDVRFITDAMVNKLDPPMPHKLKKKLFKLKKKMGGVIAEDEEEKYFRNVLSTAALTTPNGSSSKA